MKHRKLLWNRARRAVAENGLDMRLVGIIRRGRIRFVLEYRDDGDGVLWEWDDIFETEVKA